MTTESAITPELIRRAADEIAAKSVRPNLENVRALVGQWTGTKGGSMATLSPVLRAWKNEHPLAATGCPPLAAPNALSSRAGAMCAELWAVAVEMTAAQLADERAALAVEREQLEAEAAEALALHREAAEQVALLSAELLTLRQLWEGERLGRARAETQALDMGIERDRLVTERDAGACREKTLTAALAAAERAVGTLDARRLDEEARHAKTLAELTALRDEVQGERLGRARAETQARELTIERDRLVTERDAGQKKEAEMAAALREASTALQEANLQARLAASDAKGANTLAEQYKQELIDARIERDTARAAAARAVEQAQAAERQAAALAGEVKGLRAAPENLNLPGVEPAPVSSGKRTKGAR